MRKFNYITEIHTRSPVICVLVLVLACGHPSTDATAIPAKADSTRADSTIASISITRDGTTIARYESRYPDAVLENEMLMIEMNSVDTKFSFMGYVGGSRSGRYPLAETQQHGKATIHFYADDHEKPDSLTPTDGQFTITSMNGKSCSGSFTGSLKDQQGKKYIINGYFNSVTVRNIQAGK